MALGFNIYVLNIILVDTAEIFEEISPPSFLPKAEPSKPNLICTVCRSNHVDSSSLGEHKKTHTQHFKCTICLNIFINGGELLRHMVICTGRSLPGVHTEDYSRSFLLGMKEHEGSKEDIDPPHALNNLEVNIKEEPVEENDDSDQADVAKDHIFINVNSVKKELYLPTACQGRTPGQKRC